jgi:hypothetical protein
MNQNKSMMEQKSEAVRDKNDAFWQPAPDLETFLTQNGVKPFSWQQWRRKVAGFWPEEENVDDFIAAVRQWRREGGQEKAP